MYRAVTFFSMQNGYISKDFFDKETLINSLPYIKLHFEFNPDLGFGEMFLNDVNVEKEIRTLEVSNFVSLVLKFLKYVPNWLNSSRKWAKEKES